jgi:hypothetical protein
VEHKHTHAPKFIIRDPKLHCAAHTQHIEIDLGFDPHLLDIIAKNTSTEPPVVKYEKKNYIHENFTKRHFSASTSRTDELGHHGKNKILNLERQQHTPVQNLNWINHSLVNYHDYSS